MMLYELNSSMPLPYDIRQFGELVEGSIEPCLMTVTTGYVRFFWNPAIGIWEAHNKKTGATMGVKTIGDLRLFVREHA